MLRSRPTLFRLFLVRRFTTTNPHFSTAKKATMSQTTPAANAGLAARTQHEASIKRNPHPDFQKVQAERPVFETTGTAAEWHYTQTPAPSWTWGQGGNDNGASLEKGEHVVDIDPHAEGRPAVDNYKLLISAIIPRPIGFLSTVSADGKSANLAPFSYTNVVNHDPPIFTVGISGGVEDGGGKDTLRNLAEQGECVLNMISEHFVEAANATSVNAPFDVSEWTLTGLHPAATSKVQPKRVQEAIFAVECKVVELKPFASRATPGKTSGTLAILEGVHFWARSDAINEQKNILDPAVLRPVSRLGGITYGRSTQGYELLRPDFSKVETAEKGDELIQKAKTE